MLSWRANDYLCSLEVGIEGTGVVRWNSTIAHKSTTSISYSEVTSIALRLEPQEEIKTNGEKKRRVDSPWWLRQNDVIQEYLGRASLKFHSDDDIVYYTLQAQWLQSCPLVTLIVKGLGQKLQTGNWLTGCGHFVDVCGLIAKF